MVNGTLLNFDKRYEDNLRVIFDQLHLGLDALSNQKILNGIYYMYVPQNVCLCHSSQNDTECDMIVIKTKDDLTFFLCTRLAFKY